MFGARWRTVTAGKGALQQIEVADFLDFFSLSGSLLF